MAEAMGRKERHRSRELGWDMSMQGMETILEFGISLKRNDKPLKVGGKALPGIHF